MLSRTADHVYWLGRYAERAENLARMLDVQYRLSLLPHDTAGDRASTGACTLDALRPRGRLRRALTTSSTQHQVIDFLAFDRENPSSIVNCLRAARENARAVRGSISSEIWETFNATWLETRAQRAVALHGAQRRGVRRVGEVPRAPGARRRARLDAARRGLSLHAARHVPRAHRRAWRGMLRVAARAASSTLDDDGEPVAHDFLPWSVLLRVAVGVRDLPARLARPRDADARRRVRGVPRRRAALAAIAR